VAKKSNKASGGRSALEGEIEALLIELVQGFASHLYMARQELDQTRAILDDAVVRLMPVFTVFRRGSQDWRTAMQDGTFVAELEQVANKALPAMQFHDISNQLLAHIQDRFDTFLTELERLSRGLRGEVGAFKAREMARRLGDMRATLAENMAALDRRLRKPVAREDMASGEVELF
jgi:hypothetical protein